MFTKCQAMSQSTLAGAIKELLGAMGLNEYVDVAIYHDPTKPKIILEVKGNFRSVEDALEEAWENSNYARP